MAEVKNNSSVNISRTQYSAGGIANVQNLGNKLFNGYVYSFSLDVGTDGQPTTLNLNLALDKTLKTTPIRRSISETRKEALTRIGNFVASRENVGLDGNVDDKGKIGTFNFENIDEDFDVKEEYLGVNASYSISIVNGTGGIDYQLKNFRIASYSINKNNDQKVLTLSMKDNSFVLSKIYVGILGQDLALDDRSLLPAIVQGIKINCPPVYGSSGGQVTKNLTQDLHFAGGSLATVLSRLYSNSDLDVITDTSDSSTRRNYVIIKSKNSNKQVINGYGAIIILGEEDFKDGPCSSAEMFYNFDTLLDAMEQLNISSIPAAYLSRSNAKSYRTLKDKSQGRIKRSYRGNLKEVLGQWCDEYAYSYSVSFASESTGQASTLADSKILIRGVDLSSPASKEVVVASKQNIESLEKTTQNFVIKQQNFSYDLSQKALRLYSSLYYKDAKDKTFNYENTLADLNFDAMQLNSYFPGLFAGPSSPKDFSGASRTYEQVLISAILGKYAPKLRQIYNMSIGAPQALGFMAMNTTYGASKISSTDNASLIFQEAALKALDLQADIFYDSTSSNVAFDMYFGFFNQNLASLIERIESFIVDFIGAHYISGETEIVEGAVANGNFSASYSVETIPATEKIFADQIYRIEPFQQFNFLIQELGALFRGTSNFFNTFKELQELQSSIDTCAAAIQKYQNNFTNSTIPKKFRFYYRRKAAYGVLQELINDIQNFKYSFAGTTEAGSTETYSIDLADIYAPVFKQLSPVSLGALQAALPINVSAIPPGNYKFGVLLNFKSNIFSFSLLGDPVSANPIEYYNYIRDRCNVVLQATATGNQNTILDNQKTCNKTILYTTCIRPFEIAGQQNNYSAQLNALAGPDPMLCRRFAINRKSPPGAIVQANINKTLISENGFVSLIPTELTSIVMAGIRASPNQKFLPDGLAEQIEYIVLPSQISFNMRLKSRTTEQVLMPFENYVRGGLESLSDIRKIVYNDSFSVDVFVNNITPSVSELFGDQTAPSYITDSTYVQGAIDDGTPFVMDYVGYGTNVGEAALSPKYQFLTFQQFHHALAAYYNDRALSYNQPAVIYSVEIFCNSISTDLKNILSIFNGLASMSISFGESGMTIQAQFRSYPAKIRNVESLINRVRPNIKLINTNFFK